MELILVIVIIAIGGALALPAMQRGVENQRAKKALETLRTISSAVRSYEVDQAALPPDLITLENNGYVNSNEYAPGYEYVVDTANPTIPEVEAYAPTQAVPARTIILEVYDSEGGNVMKGQDGDVTDSVGFLGPNS